MTVRETLDPTKGPVINTGTNTGCPAQDQRGYSRDASCDKGAYEYGASAPPPPSTSPVTTTYYYAGAQLIALREITATGNSLYFIHTDHLGSISAVSCGNASGGCPGGFDVRAVVGRQYYLPYGGARGVTVALPTDRAFTGQVRDATGLDYFRARFYSPALGRFIQADSIVPGAGNPQNLNRYAYVRNSPVNLIDPSGHFSVDQLEHWFGKDWLTKFNAIWSEVLRKGELGDAVLYNDNSFGVFALEDGALVLWDINSRAVQSVEDTASRSWTELGLYRQHSYNQNGGPSAVFTAGASEVQPTDADFLQPNLFYLVGGNGAREIHLPYEWYRGYNQHVGAYRYMTTPALDGIDVAAVIAAAIEAAQEVAKLGVKAGLKAAGPVSLAILAVDMADSLRHDTDFVICPGPGRPGSPPSIPVPPSQR